MNDVDVRLAVHELQQRVATLEMQVAALTSTSVPVPQVPSAPAGGAENDPEVVELLRAGNMIGAIKAWRERTDLGLAEAKFAVEQAKGRLNL